MTDSWCSRCKLLGKPPARVNFIIATGLPDSLLYQRILYLLTNYSESSSSANDSHLTNYDVLMDVSDKLFSGQNRLIPVDITVSEQIQKCCHGFTTLLVLSEDISDPSKIEKQILDLLDSKIDFEVEDKNIESQSESWFILIGSQCLEPSLLNVFLHLQDKNPSLLSHTFTVMCFLVDEQRLFENWLFNNRPIEDYQTNTYREYEHRIHNFFTLLNSSKYLQQNTLLIEEQTVLADNKLQKFIQNLFRSNSSEYRATNDKLRRDMESLLSYRSRTVRDVRIVRNSLQNWYNPIIEDRLTLLLHDLQRKSTASTAARQIANIVLNEFGRMNEEELRVYKRQLTFGFKFNDIDHSNTIAAQLIHYTLRLLKEDNDTSTPLIYSLVLVICVLGSHFIFRHELFTHIPEIYALSSLLISRRQYALTLAGLRLCTTILNGDQNEHKYAIAYLTHDPLIARKVLDAIKWLLSPYLSLKKLWDEEEEQDKEQETSDSDEEESPVHTNEKCCIRHTRNLLERSYIQSLASLFYGSTDHCAKVTQDDMHDIAEVIDVLSNSRMARWSRAQNKVRPSLMLTGHLYAFLTPILQYSSPVVSLALLNEDHLLLNIPTTIRYLLKDDNIDEDITNICVRFYARFVQLKCKQQKVDDDSIVDEKQNDPLNSSVNSPILKPPVSFNLSKDLISSYFDLHRQIQMTSLLYEKSVHQDQINALYSEEWKKLDICQLQNDHQRLKHDHASLQEELVRLRNELQRTQSEREQFRTENFRKAQEIDALKLTSTTNIMVQSQPSSIPTTVLIEKQTSTIDKLQNLSPHEITPEQAEECIQEIHHRRTTFNDRDMRKSICGSLKHLGSDLYSSSVHFLHELIQNAEDNFYDEIVVPCLRIELNHSYILLSNNEQGLRAKDVLALCSLAVSTKTIQHIGEKGVGFKSVFAASNQPMLISHAWKFRFQVPGVDAMAYITPLWINDQDIPDCIPSQTSTNVKDTHLYLPLKFQARTSDADRFLNQVVKAADPCILLNMRHLKKLEIMDRRHDKIITIEKQRIGPTKLADQSQVTFENFTFFDLTGSVIKLCTSPGYNTFRVYTCFIDVPNSIEQRQTPKTRLIIAFPCENSYSLTHTVYTGLPVCDLGFNFLFNGDFQLVTSRENVRENVPLNSFIRDHLSVLFVYLLLNDLDLRKDINRYCPSSNTHQIKQSSWWLIMIDNIDRLITTYLSTLFDIRAGKKIRHVNKDLTLLVSNEQLYDCGDVHVINSDDGFLSNERLKSFQIQSVSIMDVLNCFPNQDDTTNESRQQFRLWAQDQNEQWWSLFFHHITQSMPSEVSDKLLQKPIFLLENDRQRHYLQNTDDRRLMLFLTDDPSFQMWKRQLTLLQYASTSERTALLKSNHVQLLSDERMIEIIRLDHLDLSVSAKTTGEDIKLIKEVWNDLFYLQSRLDKVDNSTHFLVPVNGTKTFDIIQNTIVPTILGIDIQPFMHSTTSSVVHLPYPDFHSHPLMNTLQWERFLLKMNCQRPSLRIPKDYTITKLPLLPAFTMFIDEKHAHLAEWILSAHTENTKDCLRQFPIVTIAENNQQITPVSATFDEAIVRELSSLPHITIPHHCRALAITLDVCVEYNLRTCVTVLQLLSDEKNTNVDLYIQWLGRLQLYIRQQYKDFDAENVLASCNLYLPDNKDFYSLKQLLIVSDKDEHRTAVLNVSKYLKLNLISPSTNQIYWQFKDLFRFLGCTCEINIDLIYRTIYFASRDIKNFFALGDRKTTLTENGMETMIVLFQYLEYLILNCVEENKQQVDLYHAVIETKHKTAPSGSREDLKWRFGFTCNSQSKQLRQLTGMQSQQEKIGLLTIDRQLIEKDANNIIYACLENTIIQNLSKDIGKRYYLLPVIACTCPLVLAVFEIDYIERRSKVEWIHKNHNLEYDLYQLTNIFRTTLNDPRLEVITAKYARVNILLSDSFEINLSDDENEIEIDRYSVDSDYPFWVFDNIILLCLESKRDIPSKAIIATSALATLLHKQNYIPFEEAKTIARQNISKCTAFRSNSASRVASEKPTVCSYIDLLFPTNHSSIESMNISIGNCYAIEQDPEDNTLNTVAVDRATIDQIYRNRVQMQNHNHQNIRNRNQWSDPTIVDGIEQITIGRNAEHFFFTYLQKCYGSNDVTPIKNWRSSARLVNYPTCRRNVDDSVGYDFELQDTKQIFVRGTKSTTKHCYFEVKGTSGLFDIERTCFHISQNELRMCEAITEDPTRRESQAYFIIIIQNCLDPERISFGTTVNWSDDFQRIRGTADSYRCEIVVPSSNNSNNSGVEEQTNYNHRQHQQNLSQQPPPMRYDNSASQHPSPMRYNNPTSQQVPPMRYYNPVSQQPPPMRYNNPRSQFIPTNNTHTASSQYTASPRPNQQQRGRTNRGRGGNK